MANSKPQPSTKEKRQTDTLLRDLAGLSAGKKELPSLKQEEPRGAIPQRWAYSEVNQQPGEGGQGGGLASPLTEGAAGPEGAEPGTPKLAREYYTGAQLLSSDGLFVIELEPVKKITLRDANGEPAVFVLANPYAEEEPAP